MSRISPPFAGFWFSLVLGGVFRFMSRLFALGPIVLAFDTFFTSRFLFFIFLIAGRLVGLVLFVFFAGGYHSLWLGSHFAGRRFRGPYAPLLVRHFRLFRQASAMHLAPPSGSRALPGRFSEAFRVVRRFFVGPFSASVGRPAGMGSLKRFARYWE